MTVRLLRFWQYIPLRRYCCLLCLADYYNQWCILPCAQHHIVYDIFTIVQCNQHSPWLTYMWAYCALYRIHEVIIPVVRLLLRELVVRTHLLHSCIFVRHSYLLIRIYVLPVLKHWQMSLMCVQVYRWYRTMHNICNHIYILLYIAGKSVWTSPSVSVCIRTRKMVKCASEGRSLRKFRWKPVVILTCKSFVIHWYRGERLIEPSSSWFPSKFPSG